jgi:acetyl-CoA C-acetyltransferase
MNMGADGVEIVVSTPLRTAVGTFGANLKGVPAAELGAPVAREVPARSGIPGEQVDQVMVGNVHQAGQAHEPGPAGGTQGRPAAEPHSRQPSADG